MLYVTNAFSLQMIPEGITSARIQAEVIDKERAKYLLRTTAWWSAVGHADLAALASAELGVEVPTNRQPVTLTPNDEVLVVQYRGPRLPEGTTSLPQGAEIQYWIVKLVFWEVRGLKNGARNERGS